MKNKKSFLNVHDKEMPFSVMGIPKRPQILINSFLVIFCLKRCLSENGSIFIRTAFLIKHRHFVILTKNITVE